MFTSKLTKLDYYCKHNSIMSLMSLRCEKYAHFIFVIISLIQPSSPICRSTWSKLSIICGCFRFWNFHRMTCFQLVLLILTMYTIEYTDFFFLFCVFQFWISRLFSRNPKGFQDTFWTDNLRLRLYAKINYLDNFSFFVNDT